MGDSVDNIPGAPGLGEKTAMVLMNEYQSLENLIKNIDSITDRVGTRYKSCLLYTSTSPRDS